MPLPTLPGRLQWRDETTALPQAELRSRFGGARLCLQGAQVLDYRPDGQPPVLWLSRSSRYQAGTAIRGGIPLCWPWFGPHPETSALPAHGFARTRRWRPLDAHADDDATCLTLGLSDDAETRALWPYAFELRLELRLGRQLTLNLTTRNLSDRPMPVTEALHSYFLVSDLERVRLRGLEGTDYWDKLDGLRRHPQSDALQLAGAADRVYLDTGAPLTLEDPGLGRQIRIHKGRSRSTVVWNPGRETAAAMADFDDDGYRRMLCVETANVLDNRVRIAPGDSHTLTTRIESLPLTPAAPAAPA